MSVFSDWFAGGDRNSADTDVVRRISEALERLPPEQARYLAVLAYVLGRVARADSHVSVEETHAIEHIVMREGGLPEAQAVLVVQMAKTQGRLFGGTEDFLVTRELAQITTREQKLAILDCLFAVSAADQSIETIEDNEIRRVAQQMGLEHAEVIQARARFREHLAVLREHDKRKYPPTRIAQDEKAGTE